MRGQETVLDVHPRGQAQLGHAPQNQRLVGGLLRVFAENDNPARVQRAINVVVAAVHVQRMLGKSAGGNFQDHGRTLARRVVILLHAVDDALAGGVIHHPFSGNRKCNRAALRGVLSLGFHCDGVVAEDVEFAFGKCLLKQLAALGRGRDGIEHTGIRDAGLGMVGNQLISVGSNANSRVGGPIGHVPPQYRQEMHPRNGCPREKVPDQAVGLGL